MSVLASRIGLLEYDRRFSKELFTEVSSNLEVFTDEKWETVKKTLDYKEILIAVYIRTDLDNLVLLIDKDSKFASISNAPSFIVNSGVYPSILSDSGLICAKSLVDSAFNFKNQEAMKRLVCNSTCYPVGVAETSKNYVIVCNTIISESLLKDKDITLNEGFYFHPIESLHITDSLQKEISKSLIIVKKVRR